MFLFVTENKHKNMKMGHIFKWGAGHHWPHDGDDMFLLYEYRFISLCNLGFLKSLMVACM